MISNENIRNRMIWLSFVVYAISMFLPMFYVAKYDCVDYGSISRAYNTGGVPTTCGETFLMGILSIPYDIALNIIHGRIPYRMIWILNIVYFVAIERMWKNRTIGKIYNLFMPFAMLPAFMFFFNHFEIIDLLDANAVYLVTQKGIGYFLWLISLMILILTLAYEIRYGNSRCLYGQNREGALSYMRYRHIWML